MGLILTFKWWLFYLLEVGCLFCNRKLNEELDDLANVLIQIADTPSLLPDGVIGYNGGDGGRWRLYGDY